MDSFATPREEFTMSFGSRRHSRGEFEDFQAAVTRRQFSQFGQKPRGGVNVVLFNREHGVVVKTERER